MPVALILVVAVAVLVLVLLVVVRLSRATQPAPSTHSAPADQDLREVSDSGPNVAWSSSWQPHQQRRRARPDDEVTYRAGSRQNPTGAPAWDPYAKEQSREQRVRAARHRPRPRNTPDYYSMLGIERGAPDREIESAYRKAALQLHPDKYYADPRKRALAEAKLKELNAAMAVLRSPTKRALYDAQLD